MEVILEPGNERMEMHGVKSALGLIRKLGIRRSTVLIIRRTAGDSSLITPDEPLKPHDVVEIRRVTSSG